MLVWLSAMWALHWGCVVGILGMGGAGLLMSHQRRLYAAERRRDRRIREEFEAYARFDARLREEDDVRGLARRVCRLVTKKSAFQRVAMLVDDGEGRMYVAGSVGMEEALIGALHEWGERVMEQEQTVTDDRRINNVMGTQVGAKSFAVVLGRNPDSVEVGCARAIMVPFWTTRGQLAGALAVCADRLLTMRHHAIRDVLPPLEALAVKLGRGMENAVLAEGHQRAGELTGLALLAGGIAHALNNPLTSVLGFSELIAETTSEPRVRVEAETIAQEARRMRETVQNLLSFGSPTAQVHEPVEMAALVRELAEECEGKLDGRGVRLAVEAEDDLPSVWGNAEQLRQMLEHLLNNAAQAIAALGEEEAGDEAETEREIRISVSRDAGWVQVIVSDTGPGFTEPSRVFDPLYTTTEPDAGVGMGLSVCYGIVHEHGGEISAFNLHPHGAALVVELPQADSAVRRVSTVVHEVA
ncbi:MAG TPA: HAMP domain-containing sensor histidine kinase [Acidobacteriaceae bacterium]|nr:HAMP domain-containing sensor histidine kinase [Acidobacteriaceae bacterium]